jgi:predicted permease
MVVVLAVLATLSLKSLGKLLQVDPGFDPRNVITMRINFPAYKYRDAASRRPVVEEMLSRIRSLNGVIAAAMARPIPLKGTGEQIKITLQDHRSERTVYLRVVSSEYFRTLNIPLIAGRDFAAFDRHDSPRVAIVSKSLADQMGGTQKSMGQRIFLGEELVADIVGVVGNVHQAGFEEVDLPALYVPVTQISRSGLTLVVRTEPNQAGILEAVRQSIWQIDQNQPVIEIAGMSDIVRTSLARPRFTAAFLTFFAALAILLGALGVYGVVSCLTTQGTREIGLRIALGARPASVLWLVLRRSLQLTVFGVLFGLIVALGLSRLIGHLFFQIQPDDPWTFAFVSLLVVALSLLASYLPARRAMHLEPVSALRYE